MRNSRDTNPSFKSIPLRHPVTMVLPLQKLHSFDSDGSSLQSTMSQDEAQPTVRLAKPSPEQTTVAPPQTTIPLLLQKTIDEDSESSAETEVSETVEEIADDTVPELSVGKTSFFTAGPPSLDTSFDEERSDSVNSRCSVRRDRSHTWSHSNLKFRPARRSGSLPPMDSIMTHVPKLNLSEGRDSPFPTTPTPTCVSPHKYGKLLVCSDHRMSMSPRLPPIGCVSDLQSPRSLPKNLPREITREVSVIDPALIDNADPTEVRMKGRRRNALLTPQPTVPDRDS